MLVSVLGAVSSNRQVMLDDLITKLFNLAGHYHASFIEDFEFASESARKRKFLFRIAEVHTGNDVERLQKHLALTSREAEILTWISRGKTNRDVGEILSISPRKVNKHLEQVFTKLGVENRAAATARAVKALAR